MWLCAYHTRRCAEPAPGGSGDIRERSGDVEALVVHGSPTDDGVAGDDLDGHNWLMAAQKPPDDMESAAIHFLARPGELDMPAEQAVPIKFSELYVDDLEGDHAAPPLPSTAPTRGTLQPPPALPPYLEPHHSPPSTA